MIDNGRKKTPLARFLASGFAIGIALVYANSALADADEADTDQAEGSVVSAVSPSPHPRKNTYMKRQWGVEIVFVRQTSAGYMLEFRYKVLDPEKAMPLFERQAKPVLTHVESGARMIVPTPAKTGALRNSNAPLEDHTYWMFFANPGKFVDQGDIVSIEIGDFLVEGLVVE